MAVPSLYALSPALEGKEFHQLVSDGRSALDQGDEAEAISSLFAALRHTHRAEREIAVAAELLGAAFEAAGMQREALSVVWYLSGPEGSVPLSSVPPIDRARSLVAVGAFREAAEMLELAGFGVRAAIAFERAGDAVRARALWSRLASSLEGYEGALANFNVARTSSMLGEGESAERAAIASIFGLEAAADRFEAAGQRERAFDCQNVLIAVGATTSAFEHAQEGYVNAIRILREDGLTGHALSMLEDAVGAAERHGELFAAASFAQEWASLARSLGEHTIARRALGREAALWQAARVSAKTPAARDHATSAAAVALVASGRFEAVAQLYEERAVGTQDPTDRAYFGRAARRYLSARDLAPREADSRAGSPKAMHVHVWHVDLLEWEERGSAAEATADVLLDRAGGFADSTRRRALLARIVALAADRDGTSESHVLVCRALGGVGLYEVLSPLSGLALHRDPAVRLAAVLALGHLPFKRTFLPIGARLGDPDAAVVAAAADALELLAFDHAIEPLSRLFRETTLPRVRVATLRALSKLNHAEAAKILLSVVQHGDAAEREAALDALTTSRTPAFARLLRDVAPTLTNETRLLLHRVLSM